MSTLVHDTTLVMGRELRPVVTNPWSIGFNLVQPLVFLALFGPLLNQVAGVGDGPVLQWFVPGIVVMSALVGTSMTGSNLQLEMQTGSHERLLVAPVSRPSCSSRAWAPRATCGEPSSDRWPRPPRSWSTTAAAWAAARATTRPEIWHG